MSATTLRPRLSGLALPRFSNATVVAAATLAMVAATAWAVMSAGWVDGTGAMFVCAVAAVLEATLVARSSAGRIVALVMLPVVGALVVVPLTYGSIPGGDTITLGDAVQQYLNAFGTGLFVQGDWPFLVGLCGVMWVVGSWAGWMAVRERRGVLAVLPIYAVLGVNALNAPSLQNVWLPEAVAMVMSLVVVGRVHLLSLSTRWRRSGVVPLPGTERRFGRITWGAALLLLVAALIVPPVSSRDISGVFFHFSSNNGHLRALGEGTGPGSGGGPGQVRFDPNAIPGGQLTSDPQPVLSYTTNDDSTTLYLRVINDNYFTAGNWLPTGQRSGSSPNVGQAQVRANPGQIPRDRVVGDGGVADPTSVAQVTTRIVLSGPATGGGAPLGIFPGEPDAISVSGLAAGLANLSATTSLAGQQQLLTLDEYLLGSNAGNYVSAATVSTASAGQLRAAGTDYPDFVRGNYVSLNPVTTSDFNQIARITRIAQQWTAGTDNPYDAAAAIESHLRDATAFTYTLKPPATTNGLWPVVDFLVNTKKGYCQYFADAMGALLRSIGIPTRLVSGYGPGTVDDANSRPGAALHLVTTSDAHVWVEVYFPSYGWIPFEPTPDGFYEPISRGPEPSSAVVPTPGPSAAASPTPKPTSTPSSDQGGAAGSITVANVPPALFGGALAVLAIAVLIVVLRRWLARPRNLPAVWRRVAAFGALLGVRRRPSETYAAYVRRIARALPPDTVTLIHRDGSGEVGPRPVRERVSVALEQIAAVSGKAEFSRDGLDPRETVQWRRAWDRVRRAVPLLLWRSLLVRGGWGDAARGTGGGHGGELPPASAET